MISIFLSYARKDGSDAARYLRGDLTQMGVSVWRDVEEMRGGLVWRQQIGEALAAVDAVLVLLTPGAVASETVTWEWQTALALGRRVIPLLIQPCAVPPALATLHYHDFTHPGRRGEALNRLVRDLIEIGVPPARETGAETYAVGELLGGAAGPSSVVINAGSEIDLSGVGAVTVPEGPATYRIGRATDTAIGPAARTENRNTRVVINHSEAADRLVRRIEATVDEMARQENESTRTLLASQDMLLAAIGRVAAGLNTRDAEDAARIMAAVEAGQVSQEEIRALLQEVSEQLRAVITRDPSRFDAAPLAEWIEAPELSVKNRLLLSVPIIPLILSYEGEVEIGQGMNLETVWRRLVARFRSSG